MRFRLHWSPTSPYVRKVMVAAHELGLADRFDLVPTTVETIVADVAADNPLARIPALVLPDGTVLFDSLVIVEYLDHLAQGSLVPPPGPARWQALTRHALAHGACDAAIAIVGERRRPAEEQSARFVETRQAEIWRALDFLDEHLPEAVDIGTIAAAVTLGYLDFRLPNLDWRRARPALGSWYEEFAARPGMQATRPVVAIT
ncbi:MAG: glutathione S-transferase [Rhodospirillaceae bacterium]|nr:glutathione S-transferase [Rhodospirillaceae bacterium]